MMECPLSIHGRFLATIHSKLGIVRCLGEDGDTDASFLNDDLLKFPNLRDFEIGLALYTYHIKKTAFGQVKRFMGKKVINDIKYVKLNKDNVLKSQLPSSIVP